MLSIVIPSYLDKDLQKTIDDLRYKARGEIEILAVLDGYDDEITGAQVIRNEKRLGMRGAINRGVAESHGDYILKCDSHCMFDEGYDLKLLSHIEDNWIVVPRRYKLNTDSWVLYDDPPIDYEKLVINRPDRICGVEWKSRARERKDVLLDETMVFQGSCYVLSRKHWNWLGGLSEFGYGTFTQEPIEICLKTWLGGGRVMVNKSTWYAHKHRQHGRTYTFSTTKEIEPGNTYSRDFWLNNRWEGRIHDLSWLMTRFGQ
jgi:glycosyltransferase involved in cell wall biosynthesis